MKKPTAEVEITDDLLRALLRDQAPEFAEEPIDLVATGWDNEIHRLGDSHAMRIPRRSVAAPLLINEQRLLPTLAQRLPLPIPVPLVAGRPGHGFPWGWSIVPWHPGEPVGESPGTATMAEQLGRFLLALHQPAPLDAPANPFRGVPLIERDERVQRDLALHLPGLLPDDTLAAVRDRWALLLETAAFTESPVWIHGDLHPNNLLAVNGALTAVIDFGDITAGDPATDYLMGWMVFDAPERMVFRRALQADDATWNRGQAWALLLSLVFAAQGGDDPGMFCVGQAGIRRVLDDVVA
jgi:aminoglycoside phosphotransferase (APT) family kinase protein